MNKLLLLLNLVQFAIILALTNPSELAHREVMVTQLKAELAANASLFDKVKNATEVVKGITAAYNNYYVCSTTTREGKTLTIGVLGSVRWVGGKDLVASTQPK
jgi:hypothetical protein